MDLDETYVVLLDFLNPLSSNVVHEKNSQDYVTILSTNNCPEQPSDKNHYDDLLDFLTPCDSLETLTLNKNQANVSLKNNPAKPKINQWPKAIFENSPQILENEQLSSNIVENNVSLVHVSSPEKAKDRRSVIENKSGALFIKSRRANKCYFCPNKFYPKSHRSRHLLVHLNEKSFKCNYDKCKKRFVDAWRLERHRKTHEKEFTCRICGKVVKTKRNLHRHTQKNHLKEDNFQCPICGKTFSQTSNMKRHKMNLHNMR